MNEDSTSSESHSGQWRTRGNKSGNKRVVPTAQKAQPQMRGTTTNDRPRGSGNGRLRGRGRGTRGRGRTEPPKKNLQDPPKQTRSWSSVVASSSPSSFHSPSPSSVDINQDIIVMFCQYLELDDIFAMIRVNSIFSEAIVRSTALWNFLVERDYLVRGNSGIKQYKKLVENAYAKQQVCIPF